MLADAPPVKVGRIKTDRAAEKRDCGAMMGNAAFVNPITADNMSP